MATIAVGDIHGNLAALDDLLGQIRGEVGAGDAVVFLGDYIDRGPDTRGCVDAILEFRGESAATVVCLLGNHEDWMLQAQADYTHHSWLAGMEALDTIRSYSPAAADAICEAKRDAGLRMYLGRCALPYGLFFDAVPAAHRAFFAQLALSYQNADCICTHAGLDPAVGSLESQTKVSLVWGHAGFPAQYAGDLPLVCGHWNNAEIDPSGWPRPRIAGSTIGIDSSKHGVLTAIRLPDREVFQSARHLVSSVL